MKSVVKSSGVFLAALPPKPAHGLDSEKGPGNPQMSEKKNQLVVHLPLPAQGCLQSQKGLQKWKLQTICDRSYAAMFSQSRPGGKVTACQSRKLYDWAQSERLPIGFSCSLLRLVTV